MSKRGGVQRKLDEKRAADIAVAMTDPTIKWLDSFLVHLEPEGTWQYENGVLTYGEGFHLSIDDGQHRRYAMKLLKPNELEQLGELPIIATHGLTFEERLALFLQQEQRKHIDRNLLLQGKHLLGTWSSDLEQTAYELVLLLANDENSPLKGRILLEEALHQQTGEAGQYKYIVARGLHRTLTTVLGSRSIITGKPPRVQKEIVFQYLKQVARYWPERWNDREGYVLCSGRGINALLKLFTSSKTMRMIMVDGDFSDLRFKSVLVYIARFDWSVTTNRNRSEKDMIDRLDEMMSRARASRDRKRQTR